MKKIIQFLISMGCCSVAAQTADWKPVLPEKFPLTNGWGGGISRVSQLKFHPSDPKKIYAISARGGLFISADTGNNWTVAKGTDNMPPVRLASVCIDPVNDQVIYLGTGDNNTGQTGMGIWKSLDGGQTFSPTGLSNVLVRDMIIDPTDHNTIVALTDMGIYKTTDAGSNWFIKLSRSRMEDIKQKTPVSRVLYAVGADTGFYRSTDFGDSWIQVMNAYSFPTGISSGSGGRLAVTPADSNIVYMAFVANGGLVYRSVNGGNSFTLMKTAGAPYLTYYNNSASSWGQGDYNFAIGTDRMNPLVLYLVAHNVWKSTDGGAGWNILIPTFTEGGSAHTDMHQVITSSYNNNALWNMNDGGVWLSRNGGNDWLPKSNGIYGLEIYQGVCSPTKKETMVIGLQDNGSMYSTNDNWVMNGSGDVTSRWAFDYRPGSTMVYQLDRNQRQLLGTGSPNSYLPPGLTRVDDIAFSRQNPDLAFICRDTAVYRTTNLTAANPTWTMIYHQAYSLTRLHYSLNDPNQLYVTGAYLHYSSNVLSNSPVFTRTDLPGSFLISPVCSVKNSPEIYYTTNYLGVPDIFRSEDHGATWKSCSLNFVPPQGSLLLADEYSVNGLQFLAGGNSVYYKVANAHNWTLFRDGLPQRTAVTDFSIYNDSTENSRLRVAMYGRGMWETPFHQLRVLNARIEVDMTDPCPGQVIRFADISTGKITARRWYFPGGTPATSTEEFPEVSYNSRDSFDVRLTVFSGADSSTVLQSGLISTIAMKPPLTEGFEGADELPAGWRNFDNATPGFKWRKTNAKGGYGTSMNAFTFANRVSSSTLNVSGEKDELQVRRLDLTGLATASLSFDLYYDYASMYRDSLAILVSTDCGQTFMNVYQKGGSSLGTYSTPSHWRTDSISLDAFIGQENVIVQFQNISRGGTDIFIDNVNINGTLATNVYTFNGNGNWNIIGNWLGNSMPPAVLTGNQQIIIDPVPGGECVLNVSQQITHSSMLQVKPGKKFRIMGNLQIRQ